MPRLCFALDLVDDPALIAAYEEHHRPGAVWQEIIDDIRAVGHVSMQIWRTHDRLFMIAETTDDFPRGERGAAMAEIYDRWEARMDTYQKRLRHAANGQKWVPMDCIFDLDAHPYGDREGNPPVRT